MKVIFFITALLIYENLLGQTTSCEWAERIGSGDEYELNSFIDLDETGSVYITGYLGKNSTFGNDTSTFYEGFYLAKYDSLKNRKWIVRLSSKSSFSTGSNIKYHSGYLYIGGKFNDTLFVMGDTFITKHYNKDYFISKFDTSGNLIWFKQIRKKDYSYSKDIVALDVGLNGDILFCGNYNMEIEIDSVKLVNTKSPQLFIPFFAVFDSNGKLKIIREIYINAVYPTYNNESRYNAACFDAQGNVYTILSAGDSTRIEIDTSVSLNIMKGGYLVKYSTLGKLLWIKNYPQLESNDYGKIFSDYSSSIYSSYTTTSNLSVFGVSRFDTTGSLIWTTQGNYFATHWNWDFFYDFDTKQIYILILIPHYSFVLNGDTLYDATGVWLLNYNDQGNLIKAQLLNAPNSIPASVRVYNSQLYTSGFFFNTIFCQNDSLVPIPNSFSENIILVKRNFDYSSLNEHKKNNTPVFVLPNPASDKIVLITDIVSVNKCMAEIYNLQGKLMHSQKIKQNSTAISVANLPSGLYLLRITDNEKSTTVKFVKE